MLPIQLLGVVACGAFAMLISFAYFSAVKKLFGLRVKKEEEIQGLDSAEHKIAAYNTTGMLDM